MGRCKGLIPCAGVGNDVVSELKCCVLGIREKGTGQRSLRCGNPFLAHAEFAAYPLMVPDFICCAGGMADTQDHEFPKLRVQRAVVEIAVHQRHERPEGCPGAGHHAEHVEVRQVCQKGRVLRRDLGRLGIGNARHDVSCRQ